MKIYAIRTFYPHWSKYSGYNRLIEYYSRDVECIEDAVPMEVSDNSQDNVFKRLVRRLIIKHVPRSYELNDLMAEVRLFFYWLTHKVDVVHYMDGEHGIGFFPAVANRIHFKSSPLIVVTYHQPVNILKNLITQRILNSIDLIIVLCESQRAFLSTLVAMEKIHVIHHGVDNGYYQRLAKTYSLGSTLKCLSVGSWLRDYETILKTSKLVKGYNIEFHIVNQALHESFDSNIILHKDVSDSELLKLYQECDILFLPFKNATANNVVLEGMACGLPVMSNKIDCIIEYLGSNTMFIMDNEPELFANKLIDICSKPEILGDLSTRFVERANELSWGNVADRCEQLFLVTMYKRSN